MAEVLITLGIIGVVAAMTIPSLLADYKEKQTVVQLQKVNSMLSQAFKMAIIEDGEVNNWCSGEPVPNYAECSVNIADRIMQQLKVLKKCKVGDKTCYPNKGKGWKPLHDGTWHVPYINFSLSDDSIFVLTDGTIVGIHAAGHDEGKFWCVSGLKGSMSGSFAAYYNKCGFMYVDINGLKGPNTYGKDMFDFKIFRDGIRPMGLNVDGVSAESFSRQCATGKGSACTGWVLVNKNLDYLDCPDKLGWDKASSCKD